MKKFIIVERKVRYSFYDVTGAQVFFDSLEEAVEAGGIAPDEQVQVSGIPYTVPAKDVDIPSAVDDAADVMSDYENGET